MHLLQLIPTNTQIIVVDSRETSAHLQTNPFCNVITKKYTNVQTCPTFCGTLLREFVYAVFEPKNVTVAKAPKVDTSLHTRLDCVSNSNNHSSYLPRPNSTRSIIFKLLSSKQVKFLACYEGFTLE